VIGQPAFWQNPPDKPGWKATVLSPLSALYAYGTRRRVAQPPVHTAKVPVICVGNINVGGTGKTPTVIALIEHLSERAVHVVSRGYGGREAGPLRVDEKRHSANAVGDEPLLLSAFAPVWVAKDRAAGVRAAEQDGAEVIILDDGFQNPSVAKTLSVVVVDAQTGFGNARVLPGGPLREPIAAGLARADMLLSIGDDAAQSSFLSRWSQNITVPNVTGQLHPLETGMDWAGLRVMAFAGIGNPQKFFDALTQLGTDVVRAEPLADHAPLSTALMNRFTREANDLSAQLVTTEKDAVRLPKRYRQSVLTLPVRLKIDQTDALDRTLNQIFASD